MKHFLIESYYGVGSKKAGNLSLSNPASSAALSLQHVMECPNRGRPDGPKGHTVSDGLHIIHYLHNFAKVF